MLQPKTAELLPKLVYHMDEPAIDMAISQLSGLARRARDFDGHATGTAATKLSPVTVSTTTGDGNRGCVPDPVPHWSRMPSVR